MRAVFTNWGAVAHYTRFEPPIKPTVQEPVQRVVQQVQPAAQLVALQLQKVADALDGRPPPRTRQPKVHQLQRQRDPERQLLPQRLQREAPDGRDREDGLQRRRAQLAGRAGRRQRAAAQQLHVQAAEGEPPGRRVHRTHGAQQGDAQGGVAARAEGEAAQLRGAGGEDEGGRGAAAAAAAAEAGADQQRLAGAQRQERDIDLEQVVTEPPVPIRALEGVRLLLLLQLLLLLLLNEGRRRSGARFYRIPAAAWFPLRGVFRWLCRWIRLQLQAQQGRDGHCGALKCHPMRTLGVRSWSSFLAWWTSTNLSLHQLNAGKCVTFVRFMLHGNWNSFHLTATQATASKLPLGWSTPCSELSNPPNPSRKNSDHQVLLIHPATRALVAAPE
jgi:hypothetical protein